MMLQTVQPTKGFLKYGLGEYYRIPLGQLVLHDCVVTTWHWRSSSHKVAGHWGKKDLFNILYGNVPLWNLTEELWTKHEKRFLESYQNVCRWHEKIGYDELVNHHWLTTDRTVQESEFSSGWKVIVNFGEKPFQLNKKIKIGSMGFYKYGEKNEKEILGQVGKHGDILEAAAK